MKRLFMKKWYLFLCLLILTSFASYGQNVYQHFSELNGMEDYNGNTNLLYRIYSLYQDSNTYNNGNSIYLLNVVNKIDSLFQSDYGYNNKYTGGGFRVISGYDFWEKNPYKFIVYLFYIRNWFETPPKLLKTILIKKILKFQTSVKLSLLAFLVRMIVWS